MIETKVIECKRCGQCCHLRDPKTKKITKTRCRYLIVHRNGLTSCRIYKQRLGKAIGNGNYCGWRKDSINDFPGCPFNTGKPVCSENVFKEITKEDIHDAFMPPKEVMNVSAFNVPPEEQLMVAKSFGGGKDVLNKEKEEVSV